MNSISCFMGQGPCQAPLQVISWSPYNNAQHRHRSVRFTHAENSIQRGEIICRRSQFVSDEDKFRISCPSEPESCTISSVPGCCLILTSLITNKNKYVLRSTQRALYTVSQSSEQPSQVVDSIVTTFFYLKKETDSKRLNNAVKVT